MIRRIGLTARVGAVAGFALAAICLLAVAASPAYAFYYPSGPQTFVDKSQLDGWEQCFTGLYNGNESLDALLTPCNNDLLLLAGGPTGSPTLTVLAAAPRADVIFDTGTSNVPHDANGTGWYFSDSFSWGFAKQGDPINRFSCDNLDDPNPDLRLCWHTGLGNLEGGYRAGATTSLDDSTDYTRYVYEAAVPPPAGSAPPPAPVVSPVVSQKKKCKKKKHKRPAESAKKKKCKKKKHQ